MIPVLRAVTPKSETAHSRLAVVLLAFAFSAQGAESFARFEAGRSEYVAGEFKKAAKHFQQAVNADPADAEAHFWLGRCYVVLSDIAAPFQATGPAHRAQLHLTKAMELAPD